MPQHAVRLAAVAGVALFAFVSSGVAAAGPCGDQAPYGGPLSLDGAADYTKKLCKRDPASGDSWFLMRFDRSARTGLWSAYRLTRTQMLAVARADLERPGRFLQDDAVNRDGFDAPSHDDYTNSGYDRGHIAPAKAMGWHPGAYAETFRVSNIAPQVPGFNRQPWRLLESNVRGWACDLGTVYVVTGVIHGPGARPPVERDGEAVLRVPSHFYKALYTPAGGGRAIGFVHANAEGLDATAEAIADGAVSLDVLEARAGLDLLPDMPADLQAKLEGAAPDLDFWTLRYGANFDCTAQYIAERR